jgi:cellulose synthase/poly-beta-1,6-N-acetylglucosamine synthase-like glycosyltransferase
MVVRNEEQMLPGKLENLLTLDYPEDRLEVVVVSDGSTDGTDRILHEKGQNPRVRVVLNQLSRGKASGLNDGVEVAQGEIVIFTDARQMIERGALRTLVSNFVDPAVGCVSGELMLGDPSGAESGKGMGLYWRMEKRIREWEAASGSVVGATGAFYATRRELLVPLPPDTILDDVYTPMHVVKQGKRVIFEPQARAWDAPDLGSGREFSRKVRTLSGNYQLVQIAPWLLGGSNPIRFEFVSHKLLRLLVPFALASLLISSAFLAGVFYRAVFLAQLAFYALSLLGMTHLKMGPFNRAADAALTFVLLNTAAVVAFAKFVTGRKVVWAR